MNAQQLLLAAMLATASWAPIATPSDDNGAAQEMTTLPVEGQLPMLTGATGWLNSRPLVSGQLRGKVVLIAFWTYTCVNSLRTLPYVQAWADKYKDQGLVVIGVHSPEFDFEKDVGNVRQAVRDLGVDYPVAIDSKHAIWRAFGNEYWPALYFVDAQGRIRHHQFGEGGYGQSELIIQQLLREAGNSAFAPGLVALHPNGFELPADWGDLRSPESYLGYEQAANFAAPWDAVLDYRHLYMVPARVGLNSWALSGEWTFGEKAAVSNAAQARITYRFHARDLNLIMSPAVRGTAVRFRVLIDGKPPGAAHGVDVDSQGSGTVTDSRMYQLIRQSKPIADRVFEIEFLDPGVAAFDFTFG